MPTVPLVVTNKNELKLYDSFSNGLIVFVTNTVNLQPDIYKWDISSLLPPDPDEVVEPKVIKPNSIGLSLPGRWLLQEYNFIAASISQVADHPTTNVSGVISATKNCFVNYPIDVESAALLAGGQLGEVFLEISPDNITWQTIDKVRLNWTGIVLLGFTIIGTLSIGGFVPKGYYRRLRTNGAATITIGIGQAVLI